MVNNKSLLTFSAEFNQHHFKCTYSDNTNNKITIQHGTVYKKVNHKHIYNRTRKIQIWNKILGKTMERI